MAKRAMRIAWWQTHESVCQPPFLKAVDALSRRWLQSECALQRTQLRQKSLGLFVTSLKNSRVILDLLPIKKLMVGQGRMQQRIQSNFSFWIYFVVQLAWLQRLEQWVERPWELTT